MTRRFDIKVDVTDAAKLGERAEIALTVHTPDFAAFEQRPIVCFAKPGAGYSRAYYTLDLPGPAKGAQAEWHASRGWVFVSVDHLGVGESTVHDGTELNFSTVSAASQAAEEEVLRRLISGELDSDLQPIVDPVKIGIGQSMGGCMLIIQQGRYHCYDGIGVLGFSAIHTHPPTRPGTDPVFLPWIPRDLGPLEGVITNGPGPSGPLEDLEVLAWGFHYDDVDREIVSRDLAGFPDRNGALLEWGSATVPLAAMMWGTAPGAVSPEAAAVRCPVLVAMGERDMIADPKGEPRAYMSANSVDLFVCPRMGHMHNFAGTRELLWKRLETWAEWVRQST